MNINLAGVDWMFLGLMMGLRLRCGAARQPHFVPKPFRRAPLLPAILFGVGFVFWNYYPHNFGLPIIKTTGPGQHDDVSDGRDAAGGNDAVADESDADGATVAL